MLTTSSQGLSLISPSYAFNPHPNHNHNHNPTSILALTLIHTLNLTSSQVCDGEEQRPRTTAMVEVKASVRVAYYLLLTHYILHIAYVSLLATYYHYWRLATDY